MTHPYLETERCGDCLRNSHRYDDDPFCCDSCNGRGRRYTMTTNAVRKNESLRIYNLLLQKDGNGVLRARFDHWPEKEWRTITGNHHLARHLDRVSAS